MERKDFTDSCESIDFVGTLITFLWIGTSSSSVEEDCASSRTFGFFRDSRSSPDGILTLISELSDSEDQFDNVHLSLKACCSCWALFSTK